MPTILVLMICIIDADNMVFSINGDTPKMGGYHRGWFVMEHIDLFVNDVFYDGIMSAHI